jgi:hypothetical protein
MQPIPHLRHKSVLLTQLWHVYCVVVYCVLCTHSIQFQRNAKYILCPSISPLSRNCSFIYTCFGNCRLQKFLDLFYGRRMRGDWQYTCTECVSQTLLLSPSKVFLFRVNKNRVLEKSQTKTKKLFAMFHCL